MITRQKHTHKFYYVISFVIAGNWVFSEMGDYIINKDERIYMYYSFSIS